MQKLISFIIKPAIAGLVFGLVLLGLPMAAERVPALARYLPQQAAPTQPELVSLSSAINKAAPAVVSINSQQTIVSIEEFYTAYNPFQTLYQRTYDDSNSLGSGVIISSDGYIITSYHIFFRPDVDMWPEDTIITLNDGRQMQARLLMLDEDNDLALLKVDAENLPFMEIGQAASLSVGDIAMAIGNPRNIGQSVSMGIISALLRNDDGFVIQTDAAINPGNSGGALIDVGGRLIGINSSFISESGGSEGIGFATPAGRAITLMENYIKSGPSGYLGVDTELIQLSGTNVSMAGFLVNQVGVNSPADQAGILPCDVITGLNNLRVNPNNQGLDFIRILGSYQPGDVVDIEVYRGGIFQTIPTTLGVGEPMVTPRTQGSLNCQQRASEQN